jgi:predicted dehydrogenase
MSARLPDIGNMIDAAVIGLGRWGQSLVHAVQGKSPRLRFVHGVSKEPDEARDFAAQQGFRLSTDLTDALADPQVQAVFLATPHSLHVEQVRAVANAGKPVWCEKPLALTRAEAARAVEACRLAGVVLGSGNNKRCFASMRELKRVAVRKPPPDPRDSLAALVDFASGATGVMATVRAAPAFWRIHVFGTNGMAEARDEDTLTVGRIGETPRTTTYEHVDSLRVLVEAFADAIQNKAPFPVSTAQMLDLIGAFEAVIASLETRAPVAVAG